MRVVFDTSPAPFTPGGTRTYVEYLAQALQAQSAVQDIHLGLSNIPQWLHPDGTKGIRHKLRVAAWDSYYMHLLLPQRAASVHADLLHTPAIRVPLHAPMPVVATIHDVGPLLFPQAFRFRERITLGLYFQMCRYRVQHIVTVSEIFL